MKYEANLSVNWELTICITLAVLAAFRKSFIFLGKKSDRKVFVS